MRATRPVADRFWEKVDKTETCWLWTASQDGRGYGGLRVDGVLKKAHRLAYEICVGPIPTGLDLDHVCHTPPCVNPAHLRPVTHKQNLENLAGARADSNTGVRGVCWDQYGHGWKAQVGHDGYNYQKRFADFGEACEWVVAKRLELFTHNDADRVPA